LGYSQADKIATHQRIVERASKRFRELGLDGISVADTMKEAGMTAGRFYKHFGSRDELVAQAVSEALRDIDPWEVAITTSPRQAIRTYVSEAHRDNLASSCALCSLISDMPRSTAAARDIYTRRVARIFELMAKSLPGDVAAAKRSKAMLVFSACVGAVSLSRTISDPRLSKQILDGVARELIDLFAPRRKIKSNAA
jgi:TetR/AcrR family transcriptional repressor of nem operon